MKDDSKKPTRAEQIRDDERFSSVADAAPVMLWVTEPDSAVSFLSRVSYLCWIVIRPFVGVLMWAIVLVVVFYPAHRRLVAWTGNAGTAAALSTLLVILTILLPVVGVTFAVAQELRGAVEHVQGGLGQVLDIPAIQPLVRWLGQYVDLQSLRSSDYVADHLQGWSAAIAGPTLMFVGGVLAPWSRRCSSSSRCSTSSAMPSRCAARSTTSCRWSTNSRTTSCCGPTT